MNCLNAKEVVLVQLLKKAGILQPFKKEEVNGLTRNGGCGVFCGDGDIDAPEYHQETITERNHSIQIFGGPLLFAPSFRDYDTALAEGLLRNASRGMGAKRTGSSFLYPHWPCAVGRDCGYQMIDIINMMYEVIPVFERISDKVHAFFHVVKRIEDERKQKTYKLVLPPDGLAEFVKKAA